MWGKNRQVIQIKTILNIIPAFIIFPDCQGHPRADFQIILDSANFGEFPVLGFNS